VACLETQPIITSACTKPMINYGKVSVDCFGAGYRLVYRLCNTIQRTMTVVDFIAG